MSSLWETAMISMYGRNRSQFGDENDQPIVIPSCKNASWEDIGAWLRVHSSFPAISIDIMRHGESQANAHGLVTGRWDSPLTDSGRRQAESAASELRPFYDLAWSSSLSRSVETMRIAVEAGRVDVGRVLRDSRLDERDLGVLQEKRKRHIPALARGDLAFKPKGGENYLELTHRVFTFLMDLVTYVSNRDKTTTVLISTHVGPMRVMAGIFGRDSDPVRVLANDFGNAKILSMTLHELHWPSFIADKESTYGPSGNPPTY